MTRVLITGSRDYADRQTASDTLGAALALFHDPAGAAAAASAAQHVVVHGAARGADLLLAGVAKEHGCLAEAHPARWDEHGGCWCKDLSGRCGYAGHRRNQEMLDLGADVVLAFPMHPRRLPAGVSTKNTSRGTWNMVEKAMSANVPVLVAWGSGPAARLFPGGGAQSPIGLVIAEQMRLKGFAAPAADGSVPVLDALLPF